MIINCQQSLILLKITQNEVFRNVELVILGLARHLDIILSLRVARS